MKQQPAPSFPITELAFDKDKKPWGKPNDVTALLMLATQGKTITMLKGSNGMPIILNDKTIEPVTHEEERSIDD